MKKMDRKRSDLIKKLQKKYPNEPTCTPQKSDYGEAFYHDEIFDFLGLPSEFEALTSIIKYDIDDVDATIINVSELFVTLELNVWTNFDPGDGFDIPEIEENDFLNNCEMWGSYEIKDIGLLKFKYFVPVDIWCEKYGVPDKW
jgi:hypothetical protein